MKYRYTGSVKELHIPGDPKVYKPGDEVPLSEVQVMALINASKMHSFEEVKSGKDVLDAVTTPEKVGK